MSKTLDSSLFALGAQPDDNIESRLNATSHANSTIRYDDAEMAAFLEPRPREGQGQGQMCADDRGQS
jgi:hypothetical protein